MKLFKTNDVNNVKQCQREFNFNTGLPSDILVRRSEKFENRYRQCDNIFVNICNYIIHLYSSDLEVHLKAISCSHFEHSLNTEKAYDINY